MAKPKANIMIAKPGQRFVAVKDCFIGGCWKEGQEIPFSPGQKVPLNLVRLLEDTAPGVLAETNSPDAQDAAAESSPESLQDGEPEHFEA